MTTWLSHPWYDKPSTKRKHTQESLDDNQRPPLVLHKRPRCDTLEHGFAHLTLENPQSAHPQVYPPSIFAAPCSLDELRATNFDLPSSSVIHPSSIEEPAATPEIKMKSSSWYEPEKDRIVITDLDDSDEEPDCDPDLTISSVVLDRIKSGPFALELPRPATSNDSMALVLFKPVTVGARSDPKAEEKSSVEFPPTTSLQDDDYAMDVEE